MNRGMWLLAAVIAVLAVAMIYQDSTGGIERPWAECKESLMTQMLTGECTPRTGGLAAPGTAAPGTAAPAEPPSTDPADRPVGEIKRN